MMPPLWWPLDLGLPEGLTTLGFLFPLASFLIVFFFSKTMRVGRSSGPNRLHDPHLSRLLHPLFLYFVGNQDLVISMTIFDTPALENL
jgi:hypothetical protein